MNFCNVNGKVLDLKRHHPTQSESTTWWTTANFEQFKDVFIFAQFLASDRQRSQRLPMIATITIAGIESESISAIVAIVNDRQRSQKVNGNHQCSDCIDRNDPSDHMETIASDCNDRDGSQRSYVSYDLNDPSDYMKIKLQQLWRSQQSNVFSDRNDPSDRNDRQRSYGN